MEEERVVVVSRDKVEAERVCQTISKTLQKKGLECTGPLRLPAAHITEAKNIAVDFKDPQDAKHGWLKDVHRRTIEKLGHADSPMVHGYSFTFQRRVNVDGETLTESIPGASSATVIQTSRRSKPSPPTKNAPFSYDPAQDFVTEL